MVSIKIQHKKYFSAYNLRNRYNDHWSFKSRNRIFMFIQWDIAFTMHGADVVIFTKPYNKNNV